MDISYENYFQLNFKVFIILINNLFSNRHKTLSKVNILEYIYIGFLNYKPCLSLAP